MNFFKDFSKTLSEMTGISSEPILLITYSIIAIIVIDLIAKGLMFLNTQFNKNERRLYLFNKKTKIIKLLITVFILLFIWENKIPNVITFISFISAAATFAIRDIILNFFAGLFITIKKPFKIEDRIEIRDVVGTIIGDVVNINTLNFEILEVKNKEEGEQSTGIIIQIPNSKIFTDPIKNYTKAFKYIWSELEVKIRLDGDIEKAKEILYSIVKNNDVLNKIPRKMKKELNEAVGDYRIYYNNLEPIIYTKLSEEYMALTIRYLSHPKKSRYVESTIWNQIYEKAKSNELDLYTKEPINKNENKNKQN